MIGYFENSLHCFILNFMICKLIIFSFFLGILTGFSLLNLILWGIELRFPITILISLFFRFLRWHFVNGLHLWIKLHLASSFPLWFYLTYFIRRLLFINFQFLLQILHFTLQNFNLILFLLQFFTQFLIFLD